MTSGPTVSIVVNGESVDTGYRLAVETWTYLSLTWSSQGERHESLRILVASLDKFAV